MQLEAVGCRLVKRAHHFARLCDKHGTAERDQCLRPWVEKLRCLQLLVASRIDGMIAAHVHRLAEAARASAERLQF